MKKAMRTLLALALVAAAVTGARAADTVYSVKISTQNAESTPMVKAFRQLAASLKEKSGGRLNVEVYPSGVLGSDEDLIEQAMLGVNVLVLTDASRMSNYVPDMAVFGMSYFVDTYDEALAVTKTDVYAKWVEELREENGIRLFAFNWFGGPRFAFISREAKTPAEFAGIRMRTGGGAAYFEGVTGMGATPVNMPVNETYSAMSAKAIDGCEGTAIAAVSNRYFEVADYCILTEHFQLINGLMCGEGWFETLPQDLRDLMIAEIEAYGVIESAMAQQETQIALNELAKQGMKLVPIDKKIFAEASNAGYEKLGLADLRKEIYAQIGKK